MPALQIEIEDIGQGFGVGAVERAGGNLEAVHRAGACAVHAVEDAAIAVQGYRLTQAVETDDSPSS